MVRLGLVNPTLLLLLRGLLHALGNWRSFRLDSLVFAKLLAAIFVQSRANVYVYR
jgi:hypothetical protein